MKQVIEYVNGKGRFKTDNIMIEMAFWYNASAFLSLINPKVIIDDDKEPINVIFYGIPILGSGSGKMQPYSERVLGVDGWTTMGRLKVGSKIIASDGSESEVLEIFENGYRDVWNVTLDDGTIVRCGNKHLWEVYDKDKDEKQPIVTTEDIVIGSRIEIPNIYMNINNNLDKILSIFDKNNEYVAKDHEDALAIANTIRLYGIFVSIDDNKIKYDFSKKYKTIISVENTKVVELQRCIMVSAEDSLYVTSGITLTHNSHSYKHTKYLLLGNKEENWKNVLKKSFDIATDGVEHIMIGDAKVELKNFLPNYENSIEGTREGIYYRCLALKSCFNGSINFVSEELMDLVINSQIDTLKELYDGVFLGKVIKSAINENLQNLRANVLLFGSSVGLKKDPAVYKKVSTALSSGIYRRSFTYYKEPEDLVKHDITNVEEPDMSNIKKLVNMYKDVASNGTYDHMIYMSSEASRRLNEIDDEIVEFANKYKTDERYSSENGSLNKIISLSALHSIYKGDDTIKIESIEYAYKFYKICRSSVKELFAIDPQHVRLYNLIEKSSEPISRSEMIEIEAATINKPQLNEDLKYVAELAYRKRKKLDITGENVLFYYIKNLEANNLKECIVSVPQTDEDRGQRTKLYEELSIPMFGDGQTVERLVASEKKSNFTLCSFIDGKRGTKNVIGNINLIAFDVDDGVTLDDAIDKFKDYTYLIYTTRNHQIDKNGLICDRYRVLLPISSKISISSDRYKQLIKNIGSFFDIQFDIGASTDIARLWFTNPKAQIFKNEDGEIFDESPFMPETELKAYVSAQVDRLPREYIDVNLSNSASTEERVRGAVYKCLQTTYKGNRNTNMFQYAMFIKDLLEGDVNQAKQVVMFMNSKLNDPLDENELNKTIFKSL